MRDRSVLAVIHLTGSAMLAACCWAWATLFLYPSPLASAVGLDLFFPYILLVDVTLGPLLTFVVYKKEKASLRIDLALIGALQICALIYGLAVIVQGRPAWLVFNVDRFDLVQAHDLDRRFIDVAKEQYREVSFAGPQWVASRSPSDINKRNELIIESALGGADLPQRVDLYVSIAEESSNIQARAHTLPSLFNHNPRKDVEEILAKWPQADKWLPLAAKSKSKVVLIDSKSGHPLVVVDLQPW